MANGLDITTIPFRLRGADGKVSVLYGANEDPVRWGWAVLELGWFSPELVRGFPIMQATVDTPRKATPQIWARFRSFATTSATPVRKSR